MVHHPPRHSEEFPREPARKTRALLPASLLRHLGGYQPSGGLRTRSRSSRPPLLSDSLRQRHHKEDVIVGSLLGIACAVICYLTYWPSPFAQPQPATFHAKVLYTNRGLRSGARENGYQYELAGMEHTDGVEGV